MRPWLSPSSDGGKSGGKAGEEEEEEEMMAEPNSTEERREGEGQKQQFDSKGAKPFPCPTILFLLHNFFFL